jgi:hypothetical protein
MFDLVFESAGFGLCGLFKTPSRTVILPTVIRTTDAVFIYATKGQRRFAMRALFADHAIASPLVAIHNQVFAKEAESFDRVIVRKFAGSSHGHPVTP